MKWLAAILMIVNVAVYLWVSGEQVTVREVANAPRPDVNKDGMLLLSETIESGQQLDIATGGNANPEVAEASPDAVSSAESEPKPITGADGTADSSDPVLTGMEASIPEVVQDADQALACYRIGPFKGSNGWKVATQMMRDNGIEFRHVISDSRELRAVRVYLGPFPTITDTESTVQLLKSKNLDHFVYLVEDGHARISLGYFTQEELAAKFLEHLQSVDIEAIAQPEYRQLGPYNWMEVPGTAVEFPRLQSFDWPEPTVGLARAEC